TSTNAGREVYILLEQAGAREGSDGGRSVDLHSTGSRSGCSSRKICVRLGRMNRCALLDFGPEREKGCRGVASGRSPARLWLRRSVPRRVERRLPGVP